MHKRGSAAGFLLLDVVPAPDSFARRKMDVLYHVQLEGL